MQEFLKDKEDKDFFLPSALYVVSTPIGNYSDITLRAIETLQKCDFVICEDSRVAGKLLKKLQIKKSFIIYNDHSDDFARQKILNLLQDNKSLALISDAGTPLISDPGYKLVTFLLDQDKKVISIPGACAAIAALSISGIQSDRFLFVGFVPTAQIQKVKFFKELESINSTLIFYESANRISKSLESMLEIFGDRMASVAREITKMYEETRKDSLKDLVEYYKNNKIKGEVVILVSPPKTGDVSIDINVVDEELRSGLKKMKPKDLVSLVADNHKMKKKEVYQRMLKIVESEK
jgi:16S rRNA (cytidine1402-2'-O)-methyltransferase